MLLLLQDIFSVTTKNQTEAWQYSSTSSMLQLVGVYFRHHKVSLHLKFKA